MLRILLYITLSCTFIFNAKASQNFDIELNSSSVGNYLSAKYAKKINDSTTSSMLFNRVLKENPSNYIILKNSFELSLSAGNVKEAVRLAKEYIKYDKNDPLASLVIAISELSNGNYEQTREVIKQMSDGKKVLVMSGVNFILIKLVNIWSYVGEAKYEKAKEMLIKMGQEASIPEDFVKFQIALIDDISGNIEDAREEYISNIKDSNLSYHFVKVTGNYLARASENKMAEELYLKYRKNNHNIPYFKKELSDLKKNIIPKPLVSSAKEGIIEVMKEAVRAMYKSRSFEAGLTYLRMILYINPKDEEAKILLSNYFEHYRNFENALKIYDSIKPSSDFYPVAMMNKAEIYYLEEEFRKADKEFKKLINLYPNSDYPSLIYADLLRRKSKFKRALSLYNTAINSLEKQNVKHSNWAIYFARGICNERLGNWELAEKDLLKSLSLKADEPEVLNYLGYSWIDRGINIEQAKTMIEQAVKKKPNDAQIIDSMGWTFFKLKDFDNASKYLEHAVSISPTDSILNDHLGDIYWNQGRHLEAKFQWEKALKFLKKSKSVTDISVEDIKEKLKNGLR